MVDISSYGYLSSLTISASFYISPMLYVSPINALKQIWCDLFSNILHCDFFFIENFLFFIAEEAFFAGGKLCFDQKILMCLREGRMEKESAQYLSPILLPP